MRAASLFFAFLFCGHLFAQLPETEIWLISLKKEKDSLVPGKVLNLSQHKGYDNQPSFSLDNKSLYYVSADSTQQTDVINYNLRTGKKLNISKSILSEYSPQEIKPGVLYSVVVEKDSAQRIHEINAISGAHQNTLKPDSVGYYCFLNTDTMVYYKLTEPHSLRTYILSSKKETWLGNSPTRGFKPLNSYTLVYCLKDSTKTEIFQYNFRLQKAELLCTYVGAGEDLFWHSKLGLLRSEGTRIFQFQEKTGKWVLFFDLSKFGLHRLTRFALDTELKNLVVVDNL